MGVCFSSGPAQHSSSLDRPHSGSASTDSKNVGISRTTSSSTVKRQFSQIATGSIDDEERHLLPRVPLRPLPLPFPPSDEILKWPDLKVFDFEELKSSTNNFMPDTLLGEGGFGKVYKGWLDEDTLAPTIAGSGMVVAIKMLNPESTQGFEQWQTELNLMRRLSHPNLVNLLGYCWDEDQHLLVYEFMLKGSLEDSLFRRNLTPLSWNTRLKIAIGAARGLAFLHASENNVIHRDVKSSNILLDRNYNAKISDFGLARWGLFEGESHNYNPNISDFGLAKFGPSEGQSHVSTRVMGTYGYAAPEYVATGHLSVKSDVYGFGVVLLEILTGMRALNTKRPTGQHNLVEWTKPLLSSKKKLKTIMDAKIVGQYSPKAAFQAAQLAVKCLKHDAKQRPSMKEVLEGLEAIEAMHEKS